MWCTYDQAGHLTGTESSTGVHTANEFDDAGILTATIDTFGRRTEQTLSGNTISWQDPKLPNVTSVASFDGALRVTQHQVLGTGLTATTTIKPGAAGDSTVTAPGRKDVAATVDALGRPLRSTVTTTLGGNPDAVFGTTIGYQGGTDRPTTATRDDGLIEQDIPDAVTGEINEHKSNAHAVVPVTTMLVLLRDAQGRVLRWRDGDQREHAQSFDSLGRLSTSTPAGGPMTTYQYLGGGDRLDTVAQGSDEVRQYTYHPLGGVRSVARNGVEEQAADFDQDGRTLWTRTHGQTTTFAYHPTTGALASKTDSTGTTSWHRTDRGLVDRVDYPGGRSVQSTFDANERPEKQIYAGGGYEQVIYDANGDVRKSRDRAGRWQEVVARDGTGSVAKVLFDTGETRERIVGIAAGGGFISATKETTATSSLIAAVTTDAGGATVKTEFPGQASIVASVTVGGRPSSRGGMAYEYPDANTVVVKDGSTTRATLTSSAGRLINVAMANGHNRALTYAGGKIDHVIETVGSLSWTTSYGWRSDNRLGSRTTPFETETYAYVGDKLSGWQRTGSAAATASYGFDAAGRRVHEEIIREERQPQSLTFTTAVAPLEPGLGTWEATGTGVAGMGGVGMDALASVSTGSDPLTFASATVALPQPTTGWQGVSLVVNLVRTATGDLIAWDEWRALMTVKAGATTLEGVYLHIDADGEHEIARTAAVTAPTATTAVLSLTRQPGGMVAAIQPTGTGTTTTVSALTVAAPSFTGRIGVAAAAQSAIAQVTVRSLRWTQAGSYRARSYAYNSVDQITAITEQTETGIRSGIPGYDDVGNRTSLTWSDGTSEVNGFDRWSRMTSQKVNGQSVGMTYIPGGVERLSRGNVIFRRDASGLVGVSQNGTETTYGMAGSLPLYEKAADGTITSLVVDHDRTVRGRVGSLNGSAPMFLSRLITDPNGEVANQLTAQLDQQAGNTLGVMLMGQVASETTIPNGFTWQTGTAGDGLAWRGRWLDANSQQYQVGARTLDAGSGIFLSPDPLGYAGSPVLYGFPWDPIGADDPSGLRVIVSQDQQAAFSEWIDRRSAFTGSGPGSGINGVDSNYAFMEPTDGERNAFEVTSRRGLDMGLNDTDFDLIQKINSRQTYTWKNGVWYTGLSPENSVTDFSYAFRPTGGIRTSTGAVAGVAAPALNAVANVSDVLMQASGGTQPEFGGLATGLRSLSTIGRSAIPVRQVSIPLTANMARAGFIDIGIGDHAASIGVGAGGNPLIAAVDLEKVRQGLSQSQIGRIVLDAADEGVIDMQLSNAVRSNKHLMGEAFGNRALIYMQNHTGYNEIVSTTVHEGIHALGVRGSQRAEALARIAELMHAGKSVTPQSLTQILREIRATGAYDHLPWRSGGSTQVFPGLGF